MSTYPPYTKMLSVLQKRFFFSFFNKKSFLKRCTCFNPFKSILYAVYM